MILEESHALLLLGPEPGCVDLRNPLGAEVIPDGGLEDLIALVHAPLEAVADGSHVSQSVAASLARKSHRCAGPPLSPLPIPPVPFVQLLLASATTDTGCPTEDPRVLDRDPHVGGLVRPPSLRREVPVVIGERLRVLRSSVPPEREARARHAGSAYLWKICVVLRLVFPENPGLETRHHKSV